MAKEPRGLRFYHLLLKAYPARFRQRYADAMVEVFRRLHRQARRRGHAALAWLWARTVVDVLLNSLACRAAARRERNRRGETPMPSISQDFRYALRKLARRPLHSLVVISTLALGIGANAAIFSLVHEIFLKPLPYRQSDELLALWPDNWFSKSEYVYYRDGLSSAADVAGIHSDTLTLTGLEAPARLPGARVSPNFFQVAGVAPARGRGFDASSAGKNLAVISHGLWASLLGRDPAVLGKELNLDGEICQVVGVMPPGFHSVPMEAEAWLPMELDPASGSFEGTLHLKLMARPRANVSASQVEQEFKAAALRRGRLRPDLHSEEYGREARVEPLSEIVLPEYRTPILLVQLAVGLVLLIVCANLANLQLAAASARGREIAMRAALGARRGRLIRQLLGESLLLAGAGGGLGALIAWGALASVRLPEETPPWIEPSLNVSVLGWTLGAAILCGVLFGMFPAWRYSRADVDELRSASRQAGPSGGRLRRFLVAAEVALALVLVAGAAWVLQSFWKVSRLEPGFDPERVLSFKLAPAGGYFDGEGSLRNYYSRVREELRALPGVERVGIGQHVPLADGPWFTLMQAEGHQSPDGRGFPVNIMTADAGYFQALDIPLLEGRLFQPRDTPEGRPVAIINRALAQKYWPGNPLGKRVTITRGGEGVDLAVVGVVGDVSYGELGGFVWPRLYVPFSQSPRLTMAVFIESAGDPMGLAASARQAVWGVDDRVPVTQTRPLRQAVDESLLLQRLLAQLLAAFGLLALALGASGIYAVVSYSVSRGTHDIGLRMALGAPRRRVLGEVLAGGMLPVSLGLAVGLAGAWAAGSFLAGRLYGVTPADPASLLAVAALLGLVALAACVVPARRASRIDPLTALREE